MPGQKLLKQKSNSVRLRAVIYIYWEQQWQQKYPDFEEYYNKTMDNIINQFKVKLIN